MPVGGFFGVGLSLLREQTSNSSTALGVTFCNSIVILSSAQAAHADVFCKPDKKYAGLVSTKRYITKWLIV